MEQRQMVTLFRCQFCPRKFAGPESSIKHANKCHLDLLVVNWRLCHLCNIYQPDQESLLKHKEKVTNSNTSLKDIKI